MVDDSAFPSAEFVAILTVSGWRVHILHYAARITTGFLSPQQQPPHLHRLLLSFSVLCFTLWDVYRYQAWFGLK